MEASEQLSLGLDIIREAHGRLETTAGGQSVDVRAEGENAQHPHLDVCLTEIAVGSNYLTMGRYNQGYMWIDRGRNGIREILRSIAALTPPVWEEGENKIGTHVRVLSF